MIVAFIATAIAAVVNWYANWKGLTRLETVSKPLATIGAIVIAALAGGPTNATIAGVVALSLCLVGDIALLDVVDRFIVGLTAFLLGHIAFIVMFAMLGFDRWRTAGLAIAGCALLLGTVAVPIMRGASTHGLGIPVRVYLAVIVSMAVLGWATGNWLIMLGTAAFIVSDSILGWNRFVLGK
ncbi:MAG TPA: lysoplasmalogenase, partial [Ilumatobacteraceae bacterium]|nr:lysoplasmalogenase [Ilumatobacteraceae bacterium]